MQNITYVAFSKLTKYSLSSICVPSESKNRYSLSDLNFSLAIQKMANIFHSNRISVNLIVFVRIIQTKVHKRFHHLHLNCLTTIVFKGQKNIF